MPTPTYLPLATVTLGSSASSVTLSNIPATYRDLVLVTNGLSSAAGNEIFARFNGDSGNNYTFVQMYGTGTNALSNSGTNSWAGAGRQGTSAASSVWTILDYSATDKHKTMLIRGDLPSQYTTAQAQRWASTAAVNTIALTPGSGNFVAGATFNLYGIAS
jgi:hypothetical protein